MYVLCACMRLYVCVFACMWLCVYMCLFICLRVCTSVHIFARVYASRCVGVSVRTFCNRGLLW